MVALETLLFILNLIMIAALQGEILLLEKGLKEKGGKK